MSSPGVGFKICFVLKIIYRSNNNNITLLAVTFVNFSDSLAHIHTGSRLVSYQRGRGLSDFLLASVFDVVVSQSLCLAISFLLSRTRIKNKMRNLYIVCAHGKKHDFCVNDALLPMSKK